MAMIKSFTDLSQAKKLAEILPIESADMEYLLEQWIDEKTGHHKEGYYEIPVVKVDDNSPLQQITHPCWSLAALLDVLPPYLFEFERGIDLNIYPNLNSNGWHCSYMPNNLEDMEKDKFKLIISKDNLVDACYEMILKLNELKLL